MEYEKSTKNRKVRRGTVRKMNFPVSAYKYYIPPNRIFRKRNEFFDARFWFFVKSTHRTWTHWFFVWLGFFRGCFCSTCETSEFWTNFWQIFAHPTKTQNPAPFDACAFLRTGAVPGPEIRRLGTSKWSFHSFHPKICNRSAHKCLESLTLLTFRCVYFTIGPWFVK